MQSDYILEIAVPTRMWQRFDYLPPAGDHPPEVWQPGIRIQVPFGRRTLTAVLLAVKANTNIERDKLKPAIARLDDQPVLTPPILTLCEWASDYYHYPLGEIIAQALPKSLRQGRACPCSIADNKWTNAIDIAQTPEHSLNAEQQHAVATINKSQGFQTFLLDGITGSGKTEVYFQSMAALLTLGKQVLVLVPEIGLTPQTVSRFQQRFNVPIVLLHSDLSDKKRLDGWQQARQGAGAIIIGTRSAIFTPLLNPGMIILDEEHDLSFKQQSNLRYSARDLAIVRGRLENIPVLLGSATPSLESLQNAKNQKYCYLSLPRRAGGANPPQVNLINLRDKRLTGGMSVPLLDKMREHLQSGNQVLLFLNRRGYATVLMCHHCGWIANCTRCDARMTLHLQPPYLHCHHCGAAKRPPPKCEQCRHPELITAGQGTERIEQAIAQHFPDYQCVRIDRDTAKQRGNIEKLLAKVHDRQAQILIGTQMLAKGHHFPGLTLVAIVDADSGLYSVDFRGLERMAQLLIQVGGRAGRTQNAGEVIIQTHHPDHPHLQLLLKSGYHAFARAILAERQQTLLPPYAYLALLRAEANQRETTQEFLAAAKISLEALTHGTGIQLLGPIPAPMERCSGRFRGQLLVQSTKRAELQENLRLWVPGISRVKMANKVRWSLDIDPQEMI
jgi:primosomal protein N' (replication factor Y) (superfamily II helicase)